MSREPEVPTFGDELHALVERHNVGELSHTPTSVIVQYLLNALAAFELSVNDRDTFRNLASVNPNQDRSQP